jgi:hypothetical protein
MFQNVSYHLLPYHICMYIHTVTIYGCVTIDGVLDWMIEFIVLIHSTRNYKQYNAFADVHTLQFTVTHTVVFSVFTSRILATDL